VPTQLATSPTKPAQLATSHMQHAEATTTDDEASAVANVMHMRRGDRRDWKMAQNTSFDMFWAVGMFFYCFHLIISLLTMFLGTI
jgi:hypothetical protein